MRVTKKLMVSMIAGLMVLLAAGAVFADGQGSVAMAKKQTRIMSLTFSPMHLTQPIVEITAEFKAHDDVGVALVGGAGSVTAEHEVLEDETFTAWEVGGQLRYYVLGDFDHGMQLGAEVMYMNLSSDSIETSTGTYSATGAGVSVGPFLGYKIATEIGFTFDAQLGAQMMGIGASAEDNDTRERDEQTSSEWGPLVNLNVGWSF